MLVFILLTAVSNSRSSVQLNRCQQLTQHQMHTANTKSHSYPLRKQSQPYNFQLQLPAASVRYRTLLASKHIAGPN
jgi:hypothetical protein